MLLLGAARKQFEAPKVRRMEVDRVKLRELRLDRVLSQQELADLTGIARDSISKMETGERTNPYPRTVRKLAEALGVTPADIRRR